MNFKTRWSLAGQKAIVTGATHGIGKAAAVELLELGAEVLIVARRKEQVAETVASWKQKGFAAYGVAADIATSAGVKALVDFVSSSWKGKLNILVNNAGTNIRKPTLEYNDEEFESLLAINLKSVFQTCRAMHPFLLACDGGSIVNVSSVAGSSVVTTGSPYAMTKAAIEQLTRYLAIEWASSRIRVNAVAPGYIDTPLTELVLSKPKFRAKVLEETPMQRIGAPEEVAAYIAFLCLPAASFMTGTVTAVDGGVSKLCFDYARHIKD